jgi:hypothetical protein
VSIVGTLLAPILLLMWFARQWHWTVAVIVLFIALLLGTNAFLRRRAVVQRAPVPDPQAFKPWYRD